MDSLRILFLTNLIIVDPIVYELTMVANTFDGTYIMKYSHND